MSRPVLAVAVLFLASNLAPAADPKPLWEIDVPKSGKTTAPHWLAFSPNGEALAAVIAHETSADPQEFMYTLRVWDSATKKERFTADLGKSRWRGWGDDLATFPTDTTILAGGMSLTSRTLDDGKDAGSFSTSVLTDHTIWFVSDLGESFHLRRDHELVDRPTELVLRSMNNRFDEYRFNRGGRGGQECRTAEVRPPREGLRAQALTMNPGRTRLVASFRDDAITPSKPRHALVLYGLRTVTEFELDVLAEATNPHPGPVAAVAFARDGKTLATGGEDGSVCLWNVKATAANWQPRATVTHAEGRVVALAFSPDWRTVAAITWDKTKPNLLLIDADTGTLVRAVRLDRELTRLAWSTDGRTLVTGGYGGKLHAWDVSALRKGE
jgi:WD40 repeat protein